MSTERPRDETTDEGEDQLPPLQADPNILKSPDLIIWSDPILEQHNGPSIASRATNRRRSSAASSRRNSLSSSHSHHTQHSNSHLRNSSQSNYVAQHLRRASIIESRRARLQDRAAHAEQVRLRAALAKAAPRVSNTEEKAIAAQQAREQYLAKVAAACADEVNRAKKIVEEMKEKRAAEERKLRADIEEKHAEAERRRQEYLNTPRKARFSRSAPIETTKLVETGEKAVTVSQEEAAVIRVQRAWRRTRSSRSLRQFQGLQLSIERVKQTAFLEATELLCNEDMIKHTRTTLDSLHLDTGAKEDKTAVRTFLSAYMILGHPDEIFSSNGQQEQDLVEKAKEMLLLFESVVSLPAESQSQSTEDLSSLQQAYTTYVAAFEAWKKRDASVLIATMIDQFVALDVIWQVVKDDTHGEVADEYRDGIRENQIILLAKIKKLAGAERANTSIKKAIRESRRTRARQTPQGDVRPRPIATEDTNAASTPTSATRLPEQDLSAQSTQHELGSVFSVIPHNRIIAHELLIDPTYKIEVSPQSDIRNTINRCVCENMRQGVSSGEGEIWTVAVAENIRTRLLKPLQPGNSLHTMLTEALDADHIRNQCRAGMFSYSKFFEFMAELLPRLCAPFRDAEVRALSVILKSETNNGNVDAMIEKLFGLLHMIDLMSLDYTNYMIQQAAPTLIREGLGYEQRMFAADLQSNPNALQRTRRWWRDATLALATESTPSGRLSTSLPSSVASPTPLTRTHTHALLCLALTPAPLNAIHLPETLSLDEARLSHLRSATLRVITTSAILLTAKNLLKRDVRVHWKSEAKRVSDLLDGSESYDNTNGELTARILATVESGKAVPPAASAQLGSMISRFLGAANAVVAYSGDQAGAASPQLTDPLLTLLLSRLRSHVSARLLASSAAERVRLAATAGEAIGVMGIAEFVAWVGEVVEVCERIRMVDLGGHGWVYEGLMGEAVEAVGE